MGVAGARVRARQRAGRGRGHGCPPADVRLDPRALVRGRPRRRRYVDDRGDHGGLQQRRHPRRRAVGRARRRDRARVLRQVPHQGEPRGLLPPGCPQGDRGRSRQGRRVERRRWGQRSPLRAPAPRSADGGLVHDELPRARREGHPRGNRHQARSDHHAARHDEHADGRSTHRTRICAGRAPRTSR